MIGLREWWRSWQERRDRLNAARREAETVSDAARLEALRLRMEVKRRQRRGPLRQW